jgi:hypothetical protein
VGEIDGVLTDLIPGICMEGLRKFMQNLCQSIGCLAPVRYVKEKQSSYRPGVAQRVPES